MEPPLHLRIYTKFYGRPVYWVGEPLPLIGHIAFGVIDRGTNVLQVRPSTLCPHSCIYCSVDAGPTSRWRASEYLVDAKWLVRWVREVTDYKGGGVEVLLDGVGEPLAHPEIVSLVALLKEIPGVSRVALETRGGLLSRRLLEKLGEAGLDRINLSLDTLDPKLARILSGTPWLDVSKIVSLIEWALDNTRIDFILTPVVVPGYNEDSIGELIELAKSLGLGRRSGWPTGVLIQKYEVHRFGRKPRRVREWSWREFYKWLKSLEEKTRYKLLVRMEEIGMRKARAVPKPFRAGDRIPVRVLGSGWLRGEYLGVDRSYQRIVTVIARDKALKPGSMVLARITRDKDNIYMARV